MKKKYDVFISYSRRDSAVAQELCDEFDKAGISYFIDKTGIYSGEEFMQVLAENILDCELVVFLGSANSYKSDYTGMEVAFAIKRKVRLIPYLIDDTPLPLNLELGFSTLNKRRMSNFPIPKMVGEILTRLNPETAPEKHEEMDVTPNASHPTPSANDKRSSFANWFIVFQSSLLALASICCIGYISGGCIRLSAMRVSYYLIIVALVMFVASLIAAGVIFYGKRKPIYTQFTTNCVALFCFCQASSNVFKYYSNTTFATPHYQLLKVLGYLTHELGPVVVYGLAFAICIANLFLLKYLLKTKTGE